jgi:hypothetical protein
MKVDYFTPIQPRIDISDRAALRAFKMSGDVLPVPVRQIGKLQHGVVTAHRAAPLGADAIHDHHREVGRPVDRTFPVMEPARGFSSPRHGASKHGKNPRGKLPHRLGSEPGEPLPIAGVDKSAGESLLRSRLTFGCIRTRSGNGYLGCCCSVFGLAASLARFAIISSYSGVPRRGGVPAGSPPIQYGMSAIRSPAVRPPAQDDSAKQERQRADFIVILVRFILDLYRRNPGWQRNGPSTGAELAEAVP